MDRGQKQEMHGTEEHMLTDEPIPDSFELHAALELLVPEYLSRHALLPHITLINRNLSLLPDLHDSRAEAVCEFLGEIWGYGF